MRMHKVFAFLGIFFAAALLVSGCTKNVDKVVVEEDDSGAGETDSLDELAIEEGSLDDFSDEEISEDELLEGP